MKKYKFHFYVNICESCMKPADVSLRPHKPGLCRRCVKLYEEMKRNAPKGKLKAIDEFIPE